jgi:hypothetical protein
MYTLYGNWVLKILVLLSLRYWVWILSITIVKLSLVSLEFVKIK